MTSIPPVRRVYTFNISLLGCPRVPCVIVKSQRSSHFKISKTVYFYEVLVLVTRFFVFNIGLPDPPLDVQVQPGPTPSTVIVEWLPVTITTSGLSNGAVVSGYAVYAGDVKVAETMVPTGNPHM